MMTLTGPEEDVPDFSPISFTTTPDFDYHHMFKTEMRKTPGVTLYSPATGQISDAYNRSAGIDMRLTSGTYGYNNMLRVHKTGDVTLITTPDKKGIAFFINSGRVVFDNMYVHYLADADHNIDF